MKEQFNKVLFEWKLDKNCYLDISKESYCSHYSLKFHDIKNKMQAASENMIKDFFRFDDSIHKREQFHLANKQDMKRDYMLFLENIISAMNMGTADNTRYGEGLEAIKIILDRYPEEKDDIICRALPLLKQAGNRFKTSKNDMENASLARGMVNLAEGISSVEPDLTRVVLPIFNQKSIQHGLSLNVSDSDIRKAKYMTDGSFKPEYFLKNWQIDKECYTSWSDEKQGWEYNQFPDTGHKSVNIFQDSKHKMQVAVDDILIGTHKFSDHTYEDLINHEISAEEAKSKYLAYFDDVVEALNTDMATGENYQFGLWYVANTIADYPEDGKALTKGISLLKKAHKKLEKAEDENEKAFLAEGIIRLTESISEAQPDLAEVVLPYLKSDKVQTGLKINPYEEDDKIDGIKDGYMSKNKKFSSVCNILGNMLNRDSSLLSEIKDISTAYADCSGYADLQKEMRKIEQSTIIINSKYKSK